LRIRRLCDFIPAFQPELLTTVLEYSNYFFTGLFSLEMILKLIAYGTFGYLKDGFNLFDGGIVALRYVEVKLPRGYVPRPSYAVILVLLA
jgi:hypothetical protein